MLKNHEQVCVLIPIPSHPDAAIDLTEIEI